MSVTVRVDSFKAIAEDILLTAEAVRLEGMTLTASALVDEAWRVCALAGIKREDIWCPVSLQEAFLR